MIVKEALDFKRGRGSKEALNIGKERNDRLIHKLALKKEDIRLYNFYKNWPDEAFIWADLRNPGPGSISFYTDEVEDGHSYDNKILRRFDKNNIEKIETDRNGFYHVYLIKPEA